MDIFWYKKGYFVLLINTNILVYYYIIAAVRLRWTAEVTQTGVVNCAAGHPQHRRRLWPGVVGSAGNLLADPLPGPGRGSTRERGHLPAGETVGTVPTGPN